MTEKRLGDIATFINGHPFKPDDQGEDGLPIIRIQNLTDPTKPYNRTLKEVPEKYHITEGDILISWSATLGVFVWKGKAALLNQHIFKVVIEDGGVDQAYFKYAVERSLRQLEAVLRGSTMKHVLKRDFEALTIPVPDLSVQRELVSALDKAKSLIDLRTQELQALDNLERNLFLHHFQRYLVTADNEFQNLDQIADVVSGITKGRKTKEVELKEVPYLRVANVQDGYFDLSEIKTIEATAAEIERYRIEKGDLLLTEGGDRDKLGRGNVWMDDETDFIFQNHLFRVRIKDRKNYRPSFLNALTRSDFGRAYFRKQAKQTTGIASINSRQIKAFPVPIIQMEEQVIFEQEIDAIKAMHRKLQHASLPELEILFQSLLQRAFHGDLTIDPDLQLDGYLENENFTAIAADAVLIQTLIDRFNDAKTNALSEEAETLTGDEEEEIKTFRFETEADYNRAKDALFHLLKEGLVTQKTPEGEDKPFKTYLATS